MDYEEPLDEEILRQWEEHMVGFAPDHMFTFQVKSVDDMVLHDHPLDRQDGVTQTRVRGAWYVNVDDGMSDEDSKISFMVLNPKDELIVHTLDVKEGIFAFNATMKGQYSFIFSNEQKNKRKWVTVAYSSDNP